MQGKERWRMCAEKLIQTKKRRDEHQSSVKESLVSSLGEETDPTMWDFFNTFVHCELA